MITYAIKTALGIEKICAEELYDLGCPELQVRNGEIIVQGDESLLPRLNIALRTAERVVVRLFEGRCISFDDLFEQILSIHWEELIPVDGKIDITAVSRSESVRSPRVMQSMGKKAIITALKRRHPGATFSEQGDRFEIELSVVGETLAIDLNSSGAGLHRRGYRLKSGEAPIRETLAAALVLLSDWNCHCPLIDPFTGSGTIAIEAAMIASGRAPGLNRRFEAERWPWVDSMHWQNAREDLSGQLDERILVYGSDRDGEVLSVAEENAERAGVSNWIQFEQCPVEQLRREFGEAVVVGNPPYGERLGDDRELDLLGKSLRKVIELHPKWSFHLYSGDPDFEARLGMPVRKRRKLYNARLKAYLYSI